MIRDAQNRPCSAAGATRRSPRRCAIAARDPCGAARSPLRLRTPTAAGDASTTRLASAHPRRSSSCVSPRLDAGARSGARHRRRHGAGHARNGHRFLRPADAVARLPGGQTVADATLTVIKPPPNAASEPWGGAAPSRPRAAARVDRSARAGLIGPMFANAPTPGPPRTATPGCSVPIPPLRRPARRSGHPGHRPARVRGHQKLGERHPDVRPPGWWSRRRARAPREGASALTENARRCGPASGTAGIGRHPLWRTAGRLKANAPNGPAAPLPSLGPSPSPNRHLPAAAPSR